DDEGDAVESCTKGEKQSYPDGVDVYVVGYAGTYASQDLSLFVAHEPLRLTVLLFAVFGCLVLFGACVACGIFGLGRAEIAYATHGRDKGVDVVGRYHLFSFVAFGKEQFRDPAFNVGQDLVAVFKRGKVFMYGIEIFFQLVISVFLDVKDDSTDIDADVFFHRGIVLVAVFEPALRLIAMIFQTVLDFEVIIWVEWTSSSQVLVSFSKTLLPLSVRV